MTRQKIKAEIWQIYIARKLLFQSESLFEETNHANAVVNVCSNDKDGVSAEQIEFDDSKAHCKDTNDNSEEREQ